MSAPSSVTLGRSRRTAAMRTATTEMIVKRPKPPDTVPPKPPPALVPPKPPPALVPPKPPPALVPPKPPDTVFPPNPPATDVPPNPPATDVPPKPPDTVPPAPIPPSRTAEARAVRVLGAALGTIHHDVLLTKGNPWQRVYTPPLPSFRTCPRDIPTRATARSRESWRRSAARCC